MLIRVLQTPCVHQHIARPAVKTQNSTRCRQNTDVGNAADVQHQHACIRLAKHTLVKCRHQWRTLASCRHITAAKVSHHVNTGAFSQQGRVVYLRGVAKGGLMPHGLTVRAYGLDVFCRQTGIAQQRVDNFCIHLG